MPLHSPLDLRDAPRIRRKLGAEVRHVLIRVARRVASGRELVAQLALLELVRRDELEELKQCSFLLDVPAERRHRPRRSAADIRVMRPRCHEEIRRPWAA